MIGLILDHLWQSSVVVVLIGALTLLFRNNSAGVRHGLWFVASLKFLFPFSLLTLLGRALFTHTVADSSIKVMARIRQAASQRTRRPYRRQAVHWSRNRQRVEAPPGCGQPVRAG